MGTLAYTFWQTNLSEKHCKVFFCINNFYTNFSHSNSVSNKKTLLTSWIFIIFRNRQFLDGLSLCANLMELSRKLEAVIDQYLNVTDKKTIQHISISVPGHTEHFFIIDSRKLNLKVSNLFSLSILFSISPKRKRGRGLVDKIRNNDCFIDFTELIDGNSLMYSKDFGIDRVAIVTNVKCIIGKLFPQVETKDIVIDVKENLNWLTIEEDSSK